MNHIERTKKMLDMGLTVTTNPLYLESDLAVKTPEEIKKMRQTDGQLTPPAQKEMSLRGDRSGFVEFNRFMYGLSDADIKRLWSAKKQYWIENKLAEDKNSYCDVNLLIDATQYQESIRHTDQFDPMISDQIARSYRQNVKIASDFPEITSQHMITFAKKLLADYTVDIQKARKVLGLSQAALAEKLGWSTVKQISNIETGVRFAQKQTELAVECLLKREKKWNVYLSE